jgi:hypothetical protein
MNLGQATKGDSPARGSGGGQQLVTVKYWLVTKCYRELVKKIVTATKDCTTHRNKELLQVIPRSNKMFVIVVCQKK